MWLLENLKLHIWPPFVACTLFLVGSDDVELFAVHLNLLSTVQKIILNVTQNIYSLTTRATQQTLHFTYHTLEVSFYPQVWDILLYSHLFPLSKCLLDDLNIYLILIQHLLCAKHWLGSSKKLHRVLAPLELIFQRRRQK